MVMGIAVRTTNQNQQAQTDIGALWQRFFGENLLSRIPGKISEDIYCVYTDYETDANGPYTTILGCKVASLQGLPEGFVGKTIPEATYRLYRSAGKLPDCVLATWGQIWQALIERSYLADFDVYGPGSQDPNHAVVETYLSVR